MLQISGDLESLESALGKDSKSRILGSGSCSALVKVLPNNADLYVAQDTWDSYYGMLRVFKLYDLKYGSMAGNGEFWMTL